MDEKSNNDKKPKSRIPDNSDSRYTGSTITRIEKAADNAEFSPSSKTDINIHMARLRSKVLDSKDKKKAGKELIDKIIKFSFKKKKK